MAGEFAVGHLHCRDCGTCLINGLTQELHDCHGRPVDKEVYRIMVEEMRSTEQKSRHHNHVEYEREMAANGFHMV